MTNCELLEETSYPNIVKLDEWTNIRLKMIRKSTVEHSNCNEGKMMLFIYVNGYLKFISKELPEIILKPLDDNPNKQEGVPYNISIGGGSQGLCERIILDYYKNTEHELPIEKSFAGTFIGDIKSFEFFSV